MATKRQNRQRRVKTKRGGLFGLKPLKTWTENYMNCANHFKKNGHFNGQALEQFCNNGQHKSKNWHKDGTAEPWNNNKPYI